MDTQENLKRLYNMMTEMELFNIEHNIVPHHGLDITEDVAFYNNTKEKSEEEMQEIQESIEIIEKDTEILQEVGIGAKLSKQWMTFYLIITDTDKYKAFLKALDDYEIGSNYGTKTLDDLGRNLWQTLQASNLIDPDNDTLTIFSCIKVTCQKLTEHNLLDNHLIPYQDLESTLREYIIAESVLNPTPESEPAQPKNYHNIFCKKEAFVRSWMGEVKKLKHIKKNPKASKIHQSLKKKLLEQCEEGYAQIHGDLIQTQCKINQEFRKYVEDVIDCKHQITNALQMA